MKINFISQTEHSHIGKWMTIFLRLVVFPLTDIPHPYAFLVRMPSYSNFKLELGKREGFKKKPAQGRDSPIKLQNFITEAIIRPE